MVATAAAPTRIPYRPYGAAMKLLLCRDREVLLHGPANTGKSMAALMKLYYCAEKYGGMRGFIGRKFRSSLTDAALVTWEDRVLTSDHRAKRGPHRLQRHIYTFPPTTNPYTGKKASSTITVVGFDEAAKQKSSEYDMGYIQEADELDEDDLTPIVRGMRFGMMPYQQLILDVNPNAHDHWLVKRFSIPRHSSPEELVDVQGGGRTALVSRHVDNPELYDHDADGNPTTITGRGREYLAEMDKIPNRADRLRLRYGVWAGAEGRVYDGWDALAHVIPPFPIPESWPRYLGLDFGGTNTAAVFYALNPDTDQLILYREYLAGGRTAGQHTPFLIEGEPVTPFCVGGAKSEGQWRAEFKAAGLEVHEPAIKDVALGISRVNGQHKKNGILVFSTCTGYLEQKGSYRYLPDAADPDAIERKRHFHYMDAERYIVGYLRPESDVRARRQPVYARLKRL